MEAKGHVIWCCRHRFKGKCLRNIGRRDGNPVSVAREELEKEAGDEIILVKDEDVRDESSNAFVNAGGFFADFSGSQGKAAVADEVLLAEEQFADPIVAVGRPRGPDVVVFAEKFLDSAAKRESVWMDEEDIGR